MGLDKKKNQRYIEWANVVGTLATAVLALTAMITVYLTVAAWNVEQETSRPYFIIKESPKVVVGKELNIELNFNNIGMHPAVNLSSKTLVFDAQLTGKPIHHDESAIVNEIPKDTTSILVISIPNESITLEQTNVSSQYVVVDLQYADPILKKSYRQTMYLKWNGVQEGKIEPTVHVRVEEKEKILNYFEAYSINPNVRS